MDTVFLLKRRWTSTELQVKVKLSLCLINYALCHEDLWGTGVITPPFLTSAPDAGERSASRLGRFTPREIAADNHWIGGWVGPRAGLDVVEKRKILRCREINPDRPGRSPSLYRTTRYHIQKDGTFHIHPYENLISCAKSVFFLLIQRDQFLHSYYVTSETTWAVLMFIIQSRHNTSWRVECTAEGATVVALAVVHVIIRCV
jgi:hypothetical protein